MINRLLSKNALKHMVILNMGVAILSVRNKSDVVEKAVNITKDKKVLNQKRKQLVKIQEKLDIIANLTHDIFSQLSKYDLEKIRKMHSEKMIQQIPENSTSPEILALYMLFINFNDDVDSKMDKLLTHVTEIDYMTLIIEISEDIGLEKDVSDEMFILALDLIEQIRK